MRLSAINGNSPRAENVEGIGELSRFRVFTREQIRERGDSLDISWLKDADSLDAADLLFENAWPAGAQGTPTAY